MIPMVVLNSDGQHLFPLAFAVIGDSLILAVTLAKPAITNGNCPSTSTDI